MSKNTFQANANCVTATTTVSGVGKYEVGKVYDFTNLDAFGYVKGNREINIANKNFLKQQIVNGDAPFFPPIIVNINTMHILDGQHRKEASCELWEKGSQHQIHVLFVDIPIEKEDTVMYKLNLARNWKKADYYNHAKYVEQSSKADGQPSNFEILEDFCKEHEFLHKVKKNGEIGKLFYRYAGYLIYGYNVDKKIKEGHLDDITPEMIDEATELYNDVSTLVYQMELNENTFSWLEAFIIAMCNISDTKLYKSIKSKVGMVNLAKQINSNMDKTLVCSSVEWYSRIYDCLHEIYEDMNKI